MNKKNIIVVLCTTFVSFCTLYAPQPLLPLLAEQLAISTQDATLLITVTLVPMAVAPIFYGYFLQAIPARTMLFVAVGLLAVNQFAFLFSTAYWSLLTLRALQGLLLPAIFTALMTYCSSMSGDQDVRKTMGMYIATTILGGFFSRLFAGAIADATGWQWVFVFTGGLLVISLLLLRYIDADAELNFERLDFKAIRRVLATPFYSYGYLSLFFVFFVFSGILNLLPFRLKEIEPGAGSLMISMMYMGYLVGVPIAVYSQNIVDKSGNAGRALGMGLILNIIGLIAYLTTQSQVIFIMMFSFSAGMFFIHATLSGLVNYHATEHKGVVNGLYVAIYYASGALGSWLPGIFYQYYGWNFLVYLLIALLVLGAGFVLQMSRHQ